jgi:manganese transport system permease protein
MIDWLLEPLQHPFNQRAIIAALLIGFTNGYASAFVVLKKSALKVGSLSHALLPGIAVAILVAGLHEWSAFLGSLIKTRRLPFSTPQRFPAASFCCAGSE